LGQLKFSRPGARVEKAALERRFRENARASSSRSEMARTRQLVAPKGTGALLSCALSPHDGGASLAVGGENAAALVFDLRGAHLVAHRLTAASGCFDSEDAVPCVAYNLAAPHALYCASGRTVTAWDLRRLPGATDARGARYGGDGATKSAPPTSDRCHRAPDDDGEFANANDDALSTEKKTNDRGAIDVYAHNSDEINHFVIDRKGAFMYAADDNCEVAVVNVDCGKAGGVKTKTLRNDGHENFVSCVALRGHKPREVVSGGLDARVCVWDRDRSAPVKRWSVSELIDAFDARVAEDADANVGEHPSPMMNPPFVHCVATWACERDPAHLDTKRLAAAACGDGTVALVDLDFEAKKPKSATGKKKKATHTSGARGANLSVPSVPAVFLGRGALGGAHASATSHVSFPGWGDGEFVVSGGNDRAIKLWRRREGDDGFFSRERGGLVASAASVTLAHGRKANWMAHASSREACPGGGHVFVADTSETISVYDANAFA
jgi:WD40 repeat protein